MPGFLRDYTKPRDPRWQASQRFILPLILIKYILYIPFVAVSIVDIALFRNWVNYNSKYPDQWYSANFYWYRIGLVIFPEFILIIAQIWTIRILNFHPIFALVSSLCGLIMWVAAATINGLATWTDEMYFDEMDGWEKLCYAETGIQATIAVLYIPIVVGSCMAVHRWRTWKRNGKREGYKMAKTISQGNV